MPNNHDTDREHNSLHRRGFQLNRVFIVLPFNQDMQQEHQAIREECESLGLHPHHIEGVDNLLREMTKEIERSEFIIYDLSHESANVYYQLGYAHGVGNEAFDILLVAKEGTQPHFDIKPLRVHYYKDLDELRQISSSNLKQMIQMTR